MKSKLYSRLFPAILLAFCCLSCSKSAEFVHEPFLSFRSTSYTVSEDSSKLTIPVLLYNPTGGQINASIKATPDEEAPATEGEDFVISSPSGGLLTFSGTTSEQDIEIAFTGDKIGTRTGALKFTLELESNTEGVVLGSFSTVSVTIMDNDLEFNWFGTWSGVAKDSKTPPTEFDMELTIIDNGDGTVQVENLHGIFTAMGFTAAQGCNTFTGTLNEDETVLTLPKGQKFGIQADEENMLLDFTLENGIDLTLASYYDSENHDVIIEKQDDGTLIIPVPVHALGSRYYWNRMIAGTVLTYKQ